MLVAALAFIVWQRVPAKHLIAGALIGAAGAGGLSRDGGAGRRRVRARDGREHQRHARRRRCADLPADLDRLEDQFRRRLRGRRLRRRAAGRGAAARLQAGRLRAPGRHAALCRRRGADGRGRRAGAGLHRRQRSHRHRLAGADLVHRLAGDGAGRGRDHEMALEEINHDATLKTDHRQRHPYALRRGRQRPAGAALPWLAGELVLLAAPARGGERRRLPRRRARHARLRRHRGARADRPVHAAQPGRRHGRAGRRRWARPRPSSSATTGARRSPGMQPCGGPTCSPPSAE